MKDNVSHNKNRSSVIFFVQCILEKDSPVQSSRSLNWGWNLAIPRKEILSGSNGKRNSQKTFPGPEIRADLRTREINLFQEEILSGSDRECNAFSKKNNFPVQSRQSLNQGNCNDCQSIRQKRLFQEPTGKANGLVGLENFAKFFPFFTLKRWISEGY
jgi:hypothetical protein